MPAAKTIAAGAGKMLTSRERNWRHGR